MPAAWLECEICGRTGNVIPCVHSERCQRGRCLICHTSILGQPQYYATAYDIILSCDSCYNYTDGCVVKDDHIPALRLAPEDAAQPHHEVADVSEQQKRLHPAGTSPNPKRHKAAAAATPEPAHADNKAAPDGKKARKQQSPPPRKERSPAPRTEKSPSPAKQRAVEKQQQQRLSPALPQPKPLKEKPQQQQQPPQQEPQHVKAAAPKRPAPAAQTGSDAPPAKKLALQGSNPPKAAADIAKQEQVQQQRPKSSEQKGERGDGALATSTAAGYAKGSSVGSAQAAAAAVLGRMRLPGQQPSGSAGSGSMLHGRASSSQQAAKALAAVVRPQEQQDKPTQQVHQDGHVCPSSAAPQRPTSKGKAAGHSPQGGATAIAAAALASKVAAARLAERPGNSSEVERPQATQQQQDKGSRPKAAGPVTSRGKSSGMDKTGTSEPSQRLASKVRDIDGRQAFKGRQHEPSGAGQPGTRAADQSGAQVTSGSGAEGASAKRKPSMPKPKPFKLSGIRVGEDLSDDLMVDEDNVIPAEEDESPALLVQKPALRTTESVKPRRTGNPRNQDGWAGHASIELDDMVEMDIRVVPEAGVPLPQLLEALKCQQDTNVDGAIVTKAVMDRWAIRERSQGSEVQLRTDFTKLLVTLKERALGQGKQLHMIIRKMVEAKKYLRLYSSGRSVFFGPVLRGNAAKSHNMEVMDYTVVLIDNKHDDIFEVVYDDQLGVVYHLKVDEDLPTSKGVQFVEVEAGASGGGGWNRSQTAVKSNLKKDTSKPADTAVAPDAPAQVKFGVVILDEDDEEDHDDWLGDSSFRVLGKSGLGAALGGLGLGMGAATGSNGFMADDHGAHVGYVAATSSALPSTSLGANAGLTWAQHPSAVPVPSTTAGVMGAMPASVQSPFEHVQRKLHGLTDVATKPANQSACASHGTSPTTPDQQQPPTPPVPGLQRQSSFTTQGVIANVLHGKTGPKKNKLMPSMHGLCDWFREHRMNHLKVHIDGTLVDHNQVKAQALEAWMRAQGAIVTTYPVDPTPPPGHVNMLVVYSRQVVDKGMEGKEALPINQYLVTGVHVVSELFVEGLQQSNLYLNPHSIESDKSKRHWQFFAAGINLMLDDTLLKYAKSMLSELIDALKAVSQSMGPHVASCKAFMRRGVLEPDQEFRRRLNTWEHEGVLQVLPKDYISTTPKPGMPQAVRDAIKATYIIHRRQEVVRYMIMVVPDFADDMAVEGVRHVETLLKAAADQRTIYAATITDTIAFLRALSGTE